MRTVFTTGRSGVRAHAVATRCHTLRVDSLIGGRRDVGGVVPGACSLPGPTLACVAGNGGVRSPRESLRTSVPSGSYGRGADRTGELREPSLMPREAQLRDGLLQRSVGTGRCDAAGAGRARHPIGRAPLSPGSRRHPARSQLVGVERGNPGGVRPYATAGRPTVRKAEVPGGIGMTREANAGGRKAAGNHSSGPAPPRRVLRITGRIPGPGTARCPAAQSGLTRVR